MFTTTINLKTKALKRYNFNASYDYVTKSSKRSKERQFALANVTSNLYELQKFIGWDIQLDDLIVDAVHFESDTFWLVVERSESENVLKLLKVLLKKFDVTEKELLYWIGKLNNLKLSNLEEAVQKKCISGIRVPINNKRLKIYARPFRNHTFKIDETIRQQFLDVLECDNSELEKYLDMGGTSYDFSDGRFLVYTQNDAFKTPK